MPGELFAVLFGLMIVAGFIVIGEWVFASGICMWIASIFCKDQGVALVYDYISIPYTLLRGAIVNGSIVLVVVLLLLLRRKGRRIAK